MIVFHLLPLELHDRAAFLLDIFMFSSRHMSTFDRTIKCKIAKMFPKVWKYRA